jgi:hypothetical protein
MDTRGREMKEKLLIGFLAISILASGWFFYNWQLTLNVYEDKLVSYLNQTTSSVNFMMG